MHVCVCVCVCIKMRCCACVRVCVHPYYVFYALYRVDILAVVRFACVRVCVTALVYFKDSTTGGHSTEGTASDLVVDLVSASHEASGLAHGQPRETDGHRSVAHSADQRAAEGGRVPGSCEPIREGGHLLELGLPGARGTRLSALSVSESE
jgi:hypothetical protein